MKITSNFRLKGKTKYVFQMIEIVAKYKDINEISWWKAHLENRIYEGRN